MEHNEKWLQWAVELQSIAQAGLYYGKDVFDRERYERVRKIAAEIVAQQAEIPLPRVEEVFCDEGGYQTPKLDSRGVIFRDGKILLVKEQNGLWALPGGWVEPGLSVKENVEKEVWEEAGLDVTARRVIAVWDRGKHNVKVHAHKIITVFLLCQVNGGCFAANHETIESGYFRLEELPPLAPEKNTPEQLHLCLEAWRAENWQTVFD